MIRKWITNELLSDYNIVSTVAYNNSISGSTEYIHWVTYVKNPSILISIIEYTDAVSIKSMDTRTGLLIDKRYIFDLTEYEFLKEMNKLIKY